MQGENIVHRVIDIGEDGQGLYFRTKGTGNALEDSDKVRAGNFVGKAIAHSVFWGNFFRFISNIEVLLMIAVVVIVVPMVIGQTVKSLHKKDDEDETKEPELPAPESKEPEQKESDGDQSEPPKE